MNSKQRAVLINAVLLFSLSELFPPWMYADTWTSAERSAGYHFILNPAPKVKSDIEMKRIFSIPENDPYHRFVVREDSARLYGQRLSLLFLMPGLFLLLDDRRNLFKVIPGGGSVLIGIGFVSLYVFYFSPYWI